MNEKVVQVKIPDLCLLALIGRGAPEFAATHFSAEEIANEGDMEAAAKRLASGELAVIVYPKPPTEGYSSVVKLAREHDCHSAAIVLHDMRTTKWLPDEEMLARDGFRYIYVLDNDQIEEASLERTPLKVDLRGESGPFDVIGDIHGCYDELEQLLGLMGYEITGQGPELSARHPEDRRVIFVGDLVDRGPKTPKVLRLVMNMVKDGTGLCVAGNHDVKLMRKLRGKDVRLTHGLRESVEQLEKETQEFRQIVADFIESLTSHYVLDGGKLVVAHAGMKEEYQGRASGRVKEFGLYGETTGQKDEYGLPVRYPWAQDYHGDATVVYGHTPVAEASWVNGTICLDTGCVFGGKLTALRYPELELVSVKAARTYYESPKPFPGG